MLEAHEILPSSLSPSSPGARGSTTLARHLRKVHAEHHASLIASTTRTTFSLDIPSDASPAFQCDVIGGNVGKPAAAGAGGLEWKVRLCLLVAVASPSAREGVDGSRVKHMVQDGPRGGWGSSWRATDSIAPLERTDVVHTKPPPTANNNNSIPPSSPTPRGARGWASYFISSLLLPGGEREYHDGDEDDEYQGGGTKQSSSNDEPNEFGEVDFGWGDDVWREVKVETVECEVPIRVWPGNTAFRPLEVVFDV